ncbi:hypothetical protein H8E88_22545 [candidate division KSB1 bacterium]|nr:hypothetical protein [candidate division KSB1 bacterium]
MNRKTQSIFVLALFFIIQNSSLLVGQISVSNLTEYQVGNLPDTDPKNMTSLYDQLNLDYYNRDLAIGVRFESFGSSQLDKKYNKFTQRYLEWQKDWFRIRIGNFYGILGRGLVFRAFELPGVVKEDARNRMRFGLSRVADGFIAEAKTDLLEVTMLRGESLDSNLPPSIEDNNRSIGIVEGGELKLRPLNYLSFGGTYARYTLANEKKYEVSSGILDLSIGQFLEKISLNDVIFDFYGEYAQKQPALENYISTSSKHPHALYISTNLIFGGFGFSAEHKDYHDFNFLMNDPPPLMKEHSFYLLNRSTHVLRPENEKGNQFEATYTFLCGSSINANYTTALNRSPYMKDAKYHVEEKFLEGDIYFGENFLTKFFVDKSKDGFELVEDRFTFGLAWEYQFQDYNSINFEFQGQETEKTYEFAPNKKKYKDFYGSISYSRSPKFAIALIGQRTGDPEETGDYTTLEIETKAKNLFSLNINYQLTPEHELFIFYGKRRGGWACTAGTCYEVLSFEGFEIRLLSRL